MILCLYRDNWFLSTGINREQGICWLRVGAMMPNDGTFEPVPPTGAQLYGNTNNLNELCFYPSLFYRGCRVFPQWWHPEEREPFLSCLLQPEDIRPSLLGQSSTPDYATQFPEFLELVEADGWRWDMRDGGAKYIHVDDLEKIEGPPPEGAF